MALPGIGAVSKTSSTLCPPSTLCPRHRSSFAAHEAIAKPAFLAGYGHRDQASSPPFSSPSNGVEGIRSLWKKMSSNELGIKKSMISKQTRSVLSELRRRGYDVYLVGGCVRDLIMRRVPKDFDIITTANLSEVKKAFSRCDIVGKRFPICHVHINDYIVEVSSFSTSGKNSSNYIRYISRRPTDCDEHDCVRWRNCLGCDFTINGLMFDPYTRLVYDYLGGMEDIKKAKVRTVIPAQTSFQEDCARILRAIRIAARLGFCFNRETAQCIKDLATLVIRLDKVHCNDSNCLISTSFRVFSVPRFSLLLSYLQVPQGRILMEMNYMLAYGSAEASVRLLWKFGLLELLLPIQAAYFVSQGFRRRDRGTNMLLALLSNLDSLLAPDKPCHDSLWVAILAFHEALACVPRDPLVVATFSLVVHNGGDMLKAVNISRRITIQSNQNYSEILEPRMWDEDKDLINEVLDLASSVIAALGSMTDEYFVSQKMAQYPQAPMSNLVFIPLQLYLMVCRIFECIKSRDSDGGFVPKQGSKINYQSLAHGGLAELRHVFARVVFDTVYPPNIDEQDMRSSSCTGSS